MSTPELDALWKELKELVARETELRNWWERARFDHSLIDRTSLREEIENKRRQTEILKLINDIANERPYYKYGDEPDDRR